MTRTQVYEFMAGQTLAVLGSVSSDGLPQSALVGIAVTEHLEVIFDTVSDSRKCRNLIANPAASFVMGWTGEITLQLEGRAFQPRDDELARYKDVYFAKWPDCVSHQSWPGITYFVVRPHWIRYSDFNQRPPLFAEFAL
jgi:pyridoxine/pyridoxamine 5'-phosphate oxidase